jgi:hypothetical protein
MANDDKQQRIEAVFSNIGLGNSDAESVAEIVDNYNQAMSNADFARNNTGKKKFKDVLASAENKVEENK